MSSKGKRSSILKKQQSAPSLVGRTDPVAPSASSSSGYKNLKRIEFNRKKSVKEFTVGEDVDTIWGNSYEVSTDGTPSSGLDDATLGNSTYRNSTVDEQNKENCSTNHLPPVDDSLRAGTTTNNNTNTSWDLSITIADDEKRKLRSETSAVFSQSLNTTERLLIEPTQPPPDRVTLKVPTLLAEESEVQAMDISPIKPSVVASPIKSPRKMIYNFPKQSMFVEINDIPASGVRQGAEERTSSQREGQKTPVRPSWRTGMSSANDQTTFRGSSYNASETWNSHPHALYQRGLSVHTRPSGGDLANVSSDVDTTIALTNAMTQVLQSCSNESIQRATNMDLDESTTTLPSNALARARPSFLPSNHRANDGKELRTPPNGKRERETLHGAALEDTNLVDISSPVEGHAQRGSLSFENLSILTEGKQLETGPTENKSDRQEPLPEKEKSATKVHGNGLVVDLGLSSLSLKFRPSSPEIPVNTKPRILRPTLPAGLLESATKKSEPNKTVATDEYDRSRSIKHTPKMTLSRQNATTVKEREDGESICKKSLVPMDISTNMQTSIFSSIPSRMTTVGMEEEEEDEKPPMQHTRPTVFHSTDIVIDRVAQNGPRETIVYDEKMELTTVHPDKRQADPPNPPRRTIYRQEPILDETVQIKHSSTIESMKRATVHGAVAIDESDCSPHSPQTALANYRRTVYPLDGMKEEASIVPSTRKTILSNDEMVLDVCATPNAKTNSETSISCVLYGRNVDELSIHAANRSNVVDLKFTRPTTFQPQVCEESSVHVERGRQTLMQTENMILSEGSASKPSRQRQTTLTEHAMEEDNSPAVHPEKKNNTIFMEKHSRKSNVNAERMELTLVEQTMEVAPLKEVVTGRSTTHATDVMMDVSIVEEIEQADQPAHPHGGEDNADIVKKWQRSRIPRPTTHVREDMEGIVQREEPVRPKTRYSTYEREDMEVTKLDTGGNIDQGEQGERSERKIVEDKMPIKGIQSKDQPRLSIYEQEDMNATNVCGDQRAESSRIEDFCKPLDLERCDKSTAVPETVNITATAADGKSFHMDLTGTETVKSEFKSPTGPVDVKDVRATDWDNEQRHNVTNYNTFLDHYEMSHEIGHGASTAVQDPQEKQFNSTRLSKAYDMDEAQPLPVPTRPSTYQAVAMDETNIDGRELPPEKHSIADVQFDSPMHMSPVAEVFYKPKNAARRSTYHAEEMDSTQVADKLDEVQVAHKSSSCFRKSNLQSIAKESAANDMEGISVLETDETDPETNSSAAAGTRGTIFFNAPAVIEEERGTTANYLPSKEEERLKTRPNNRLSIYDAAAMVEETVPINHLILKQGLKSCPQEPLPCAAGGMQRKSNDCMDETIVPENIRVERNVKFTRQSLARMGISVEGSPYVCPAEAMPLIEQRQTIASDTEETMELTRPVTKAYNHAEERQRNRQTIHQPYCMELTMVGRETVTPPPVDKPSANLDRRTIYNSGAMEQTPPLHTATTVEVPVKSEKHIQMEKQLRRPRQTILIPQDMDVVEDEEDVKPKEEQHSFALSMLPRETTEDYVPRSASLLPKRAFVQQPLSETCREFAKPNQPEPMELMFQKQSQTTIARKTVIGDAPELSDISMSTSALRPEIPCIGNITAMMSMREITEPTLPQASFQDHSKSVSVICRVDSRQTEVPVEQETAEQAGNETVGLQTLAFVPTRSNGASDDEFYDAEGDEQPIDPLSLTKSRHLSMKFVDVDHLEQTGYGVKGTTLPSIARNKRAHAQVLCSPVVSRAADDDRDPLQMTNVRQTLTADSQQTPNGPIKKRARKSSNINPMQQISTQIEEDEGAALEPVTEVEEVSIKEEPQTLPNIARASMALIHDPSVFVLEGDEGDLLEDESDIACASLTEETQPDENGSERLSTASPSSTSRPRLSKIAELSYYKDFANLTIDSWETGGGPTPTPHGEQADGASVEECISVSDEDSLIITPPKVPLADRVKGRLLEGILKPTSRPSSEVLDSTIASEIMYQIRQQHPMVKHPCCGMPTECICPLRRELNRRQEASDMVWDRWCTRFATIKQRAAATAQAADEGSEINGEEEDKPKTFVEQFEELNWRLLRGQYDERYLFAKGELCGEELSRRRSRTIVSGHYPETPSVAFLADNLRSFLSEQLYIDDGPPPGATMPAIPRITQLIANKLNTDSGTRWMLDCSEEGDGLLLFRHRTLRSFVLSVQVQPPRGKAANRNVISENWRLERIQVRECQQEYIHSPKLLLAHIEFMRLAKETTEQTLRATYRSVADLMGLWHRFNEQLERIFEAVNRLLTIVRNNEALLCYDAQMERFCVKKCFHRTGDDGQIDANVLQVHFSCIGSIGAPGVGFRWPMVDPLHKLLPAGTSQHSVASTHLSNGVVGSDHKAGLMFLECLLWNVTKQYES